MAGSGYSATDKFLHRTYLGNYSVSKASFEVEESIHGARAKKWSVEQKVFVTGLARAGTTAVMRELFNTREYASLQYSNMPYLFMPNMWKRKSKIAAHERAHNDGIIVDGNSPEEFDEYFWKAYLNDSFIHEHFLKAHDVDEGTMDKFITYTQLIALSKKKNRYLSKNNNNILRLSALNGIENSKILIVYRNPVNHASSLFKLHKSFMKSQKEDPFILEYFNYLGHHEFGLNHKPFVFEGKPEFLSHPKDSMDYWVLNWINYYAEVLKIYNEAYRLVCFEDLIKDPNRVYSYLYSDLDIDSPSPQIEPFTPPDYDTSQINPDILLKAQQIYTDLGGLIRY